VTIAPQTTGVHHLALRSSDLTRARHFYGLTLGLPIVLETWDLFMALAGSTVLIVRSLDTQTPALSTGPGASRASSRDAGDRVDSSPVGLDYVALACADETELERVVRALETADVPSSGLRFDPVLRRRYVAFEDPDGIGWQFYMAFSHNAVVCGSESQTG
jgi:catechol 2,3-dioxygenase-like lactoylglutathione lyase family enzyme